MRSVRRILLLMLAVAGCGKPNPAGPPAKAAAAPTAPASTGKEVQPTAPPSQVANPPEVANQPEKDSPEVATGEFGSPAAKRHPEQAKAMLAAAEKAWEATVASYEVGTTTLTSVHHWSRKLLEAQRAFAETKEEDLAALLAHWKRTRQTYLKVRALYDTGTRGGETELFAAAAFYLAQAELWLVDAGGTIPEEID